MQQHHHHHQLHSSASRNGVADGSLTWEVPPSLDRSWGPAVSDLPLHSPRPAAAPSPTPGEPEASEGADGDPEGADGAGTPSSCYSIGALPPSGGASSGLHPLVLLYRQELGAAAEEHLQLMLRQLLAAEDVQQPEVGAVVQEVAWGSCSLLRGLPGSQCEHKLHVSCQPGVTSVSPDPHVLMPFMRGAVGLCVCRCGCLYFCSSWKRRQMLFSQLQQQHSARTIPGSMSRCVSGSPEQVT